VLTIRLAAFVADRHKPHPCTREPRQGEQFRFNDNEQPMGNKQTDGVGTHHHQPARDPVPLASDENGLKTVASFKGSTTASGAAKMKSAG